MSDLGRWRELAFQKPAHADLPILPGHIRALRPQMNGRLLVEGWMMTRDQPLDGVSVYFNGGHLEDCLLNNDAGVAAAFPDVPHAATREFRFELPIRDHSTNVAPRVDVIGTFRGHPHGRRGQIVSSVLDTLPSSPEELMYRVSHTRDAHSFKVGGLQTLGEFLEPLQRHKSLSQVKRILDWVCGCGRLPMLFLAIIDESPEVWGCDVDPRGVDWCNKALRANAFHTLAPLPPTPYAAEQFDLILSYSVFTHLSRENQEAWLIEMSRILAPGGVFMATTHGDFAYRLSVGRGDAELPPPGIVDSTIDDALGDVVPKHYYRATYQSKSYTLTEFGKYFGVIEYIAQGANGIQDLVVMGKL